MLDIILWVIAAALMVIGFAGTIVPMIPGSRSSLQVRGWPHSSIITTKLA